MFLGHCYSSPAMFSHLPRKSQQRTNLQKRPESKEHITSHHFLFTTKAGFLWHPLVPLSVMTRPAPPLVSLWPCFAVRLTSSFGDPGKLLQCKTSNPHQPSQNLYFHRRSRQRLCTFKSEKLLPTEQ